MESSARDQLARGIEIDSFIHEVQLASHEDDGSQAREHSEADNP
jgi:hypothetical protein